MVKIKRETNNQLRSLFIISSLWHPKEMDPATFHSHKMLPTCSSTLPSFLRPAICARYWITFFVFSVFPAPDSPLKFRYDPYNQPYDKHDMGYVEIIITGPSRLRDQNRLVAFVYTIRRGKPIRGRINRDAYRKSYPCMPGQQLRKYGVELHP